jgi:hypothetical protein
MSSILEYLSKSITKYTFDSSLCDISGNICCYSKKEYKNGDSIIKINECGHSFLEKNFLYWFGSKEACPICRCFVESNLDYETELHRYYEAQDMLTIDEIDEEIYRSTRYYYKY